MEQLSDKIKKIQELRKNDAESEDRLRQIGEMNKKFQQLVEKGLTKPRGYNLMTIDEIPRSCEFYV
jgi:hypothetical protein